ncbi:hypothetical protein [Pseudonocardia sp.]|uniref:hypothetical protein n=1 Tax=Pseudonocardia sp. TaxID=60912 RepID=UPI003D0F2CBD
MPGLEDILRQLLRMEGVLCAGVAERDSGRLLAAAGNGSLPNVMGPSIAALARLSGQLDGPAGRDAGTADIIDGDLEDVMITSERLFHVLRQVDVAGSGPVLVYVRLRRGHGNPATCRRELASAELRDSVAAACGPPRPAAIPGAMAGNGTVAPRLDTGSHPALPAVEPPRRPAPPRTSRPAAADGPATTRLPAPRATPASRGVPSPAAPELPRRVRGSHLVGVPDPVDRSGRPPATSGVLQQGWAKDGRTLRRLLAGLRRLG